jgi:hypothetical protein
METTMPKSNATAQKHHDEQLSSSTSGRKPVDKFQDGPLHVSIWENQGVKGAFRTATFELRYKTEDEWKTSNSYGSSDLRHLELAAAEARARIEKWQKENRASINQTPA